MKNLTYISILVSIFVSLFACKRDCDYSDENCTDEERSWLSYNGGEALIFKDNIGNFDSTVVSRMVSTMERGGHEYEDPCTYLYQKLYLEIPLKHDRLKISVSHYNAEFYYNANSAGIYSNSTTFYFSNYSPVQTFDLNGKIYNDVFIMTDTTIVSTNALFRIYYTKMDGIIGYDYKGGEEWVKVN